MNAEIQLNKRPKERVTTPTPLSIFEDSVNNTECCHFHRILFSSRNKAVRAFGPYIPVHRRKQSSYSNSKHMALCSAHVWRKAPAGPP